MTIRSLAEGHTKFTILTVAPAKPNAPTVAELEAGIDASCKVAKNDFNFSTADSDTVDDAELCATTKAVAPGADNVEVNFRAYRYWLDEGGVDPAADVLFAAVREKGTVLYFYARHTDKLATEPWAAGDEIFLGVEGWVDWPQYNVADAGWNKFITKVHANNVYPQIKVAAA